MLAGLFRIVLTLALAAAVLWIGLPIAASSLAGAAVAAAGFHGDDVKVSVIADPPLKLLLLEADTVNIEAGRSTWRGITFAKVDLTVGTVRAGGAGGTVEGRLDGVDLPDGSGGTVRAGSIVVSGPAANVGLTADFSREELQGAVQRALSVQPGDLLAITLAAPDGVRVATAAGSLFARLVVEADGSLGLLVTAPGGADRTITILQPGPALPIRFGAVAVSAEAVEVRGVVDARSIGL